MGRAGPYRPGTLRAADHHSEGLCTMAFKGEHLASLGAAPWDWYAHGAEASNPTDCPKTGRGGA